MSCRTVSLSSRAVLLSCRAVLLSSRAVLLSSRAVSLGYQAMDIDVMNWLRVLPPELFCPDQRAFWERRAVEDQKKADCIEILSVRAARTAKTLSCRAVSI